MSSDSIAIRLHGVGKRYEIFQKPHQRLLQILSRGKKQYAEEFVALEGINFEVFKGETVGIIGKNGAGKSTLLQIVCGTLAPTSGTLEINGRIAALLELGAGFNLEFSGLDNIYMYATLLGLDKSEIDTKLDAIINFADIGSFLYQPVKTYSSGMFVRLAFSVIAHVDADILIIDEALAVGDVFFTQKCMRYLRKFQETGTILFVSHDTSAVVNFCNRALWLEQGQMKMAGSSKEVTERYLEGLYAAQQDVSLSQSSVEAEKASPQPETFVDQRLPFIQNSNLRNDLEVFHFNDLETGFGTGVATITRVRLTDDEGAPLSWAVGGEHVTLKVEVNCSQAVTHPIIGFIVKDKLGQTLFGDNTYLSSQKHPISTAAGDLLTATFNFAMPILPAGPYSVTVAIAEGTQEEHIQHHWIHEAITFESHSSSLSTGLIGLPMREITMTTESKVHQ